MRYLIARTWCRGPVDPNESFALDYFGRSKNFRNDLFDRALIWNQAHLRQVLHEYERYYSEHRALAPPCGPASG